MHKDDLSVASQLADLDPSDITKLLELISRLTDRGDADTIKSFCQSEKISESFYFKLRAMGLGPKEMRFLSLVRISPQAKVEWRRRMEASTAVD